MRRNTAVKVDYLDAGTRKKFFTLPALGRADWTHSFVTILGDREVHGGNAPLLDQPSRRIRSSLEGRSSAVPPRLNSHAVRYCKMLARSGVSAAMPGMR
jgi:hypothetical protein